MKSENKKIKRKSDGVRALRHPSRDSFVNPRKKIARDLRSYPIKRKKTKGTEGQKISTLKFLFVTCICMSTSYFAVNLGQNSLKNWIVGKPVQSMQHNVNFTDNSQFYF